MTKSEADIVIVSKYSMAGEVGRPGLQLRCARTVPCAQPAPNTSGQCPHVPWAREHARPCQGGRAAAARGACLNQ